MPRIRRAAADKTEADGAMRTHGLAGDSDSDSDGAPRPANVVFLHCQVCGALFEMGRYKQHAQWYH